MCVFASAYVHMCIYIYIYMCIYIYTHIYDFFLFFLESTRQARGAGIPLPSLCGRVGFCFLGSTGPARGLVSPCCPWMKRCIVCRVWGTDCASDSLPIICETHGMTCAISSGLMSCQFRSSSQSKMAARSVFSCSCCANVDQSSFTFAGSINCATASTTSCLTWAMSIYDLKHRSRRAHRDHVAGGVPPSLETQCGTHLSASLTAGSLCAAPLRSW